jgi:8-oxo-dGTP diphosphatase
MRSPHLYGAVYAIIRDASGKILFMQRKDSGFKDGKYQLPAGHLESGELVKSALARELLEELCITVQESDMEVVHVGHRIAPDREYFDVYVECAEIFWNYNDRWTW